MEYRLDLSFEVVTQFNIAYILSPQTGEFLVMTLDSLQNLGLVKRAKTIEALMPRTQQVAYALADAIRPSKVALHFIESIGICVPSALVFNERLTTSSDVIKSYLANNRKNFWVQSHDDDLQQDVPHPIVSDLPGSTPDSCHILGCQLTPNDLLGESATFIPDRRERTISSRDILVAVGQ
jgi:hypothetical protein